MKQIIQNYRTGVLELAEVPVPLCSPDKLLVKNEASLISIGTERSIIELGQKSLLGKAKARPDLVKRFLDKAKKEGFVKTFQEALGRLDNPTPLGYSSAGIVVEAGANVHKFSPGDRVACIGAGYASHAEYVTVPQNLCCRMPDNISFEDASFGMLGIIALHGIRCAKLTFGETVAVTGLGLLGLLAVQILKAYGCRVIGMDIDPAKVWLSKQLGADDAFTSEAEFKSAVEERTSGYGADAVIITAATKSDAPVNTAVEIARQGCRIVLVGVADIHPQRNEMWHKEVEIVVSKAGGPGVFDPFYEGRGIDYPLGYIRWTVNRNLDEFLRLVAAGKINVKELVSHRFQLHEAERVYSEMLDGRGGPYVGVLLEYPQSRFSQRIPARTVGLAKKANRTFEGNSVCLGVIGAGLFGKALLLPALKSMNGIRLHTLSTSSGSNSYHAAKKYGFENCTTDYKELLANEDINAVMVLTPHSLHAKMVIESLKAGKHVFVEKPLCIGKDELNEIIKTHREFPDKCIAVGYNRRFSPHSRKAWEHLNSRHAPMVINYRVNAGFVPPDHWVHSEKEGGSRIIGEVCHFIDMMQYLTNGVPVRVYAERISGNNRTALNSDNVVITVKFSEGSLGTIIYSASGDKAYAREQVEMFCEGSTITISDFRETVFYKSGGRKKYRTVNQEMGYKEELSHFLATVTGKEPGFIPAHDIFYSTLAVFGINKSLSSGTPVPILFE